MPSREEMIQALQGLEKSQPPSREQMIAELQKVEQSNAPGPAQTALEHAGNTITMGYLPQLQAITDPMVDQIMGMPPENTTYLQRRDENIKRLQNEAQANPKAALGGSVAGGLVGSAVTPIPGGAAAKGLLGLAGKGAAYGGAVGALANPGDKPGEVDPLQLSERAGNAGMGALIGAGGGAATGLVAKGSGMLSRAPEAAKAFAEQKAFKGTGAMLKDFRTANAKGKVQETGRFMLDRGLIKAGDTFEDVAEKASQLKQQAGQQLEELYSMTGGAAQTVGFNPVRDKEIMLKSASEKLGDSVGGKGAIERLSSYLDELGQKYGDQVLDPKKANDIKGALDDAINYSRNPLTKQPEVEKAFSAARKQVAQKIEEHVDTLGKAGSNPDAAKALRAANRDYGMSSEISRIANDRAQRESANRMMGLTDTIAGSAGAGVGAIGGAAMGHPGLGAALVGGAGAVGNKLARTYGNGLLAQGADQIAAPLLQYTAAPVGRAGNALTSDPRLLSQALARLGLLNTPDVTPPEQGVPDGLIYQARAQEKKDKRKAN